MTIKSKGTSPNFNSLSFSEIETEFGSNPGRKLGRYRTDDTEFKNKNLGALSNLPLDTGIPTSGEIKFSDFYDKKLNMVVDYFDDTGSAGGQADNILNRQDNGDNTMAATWRYNNQEERVKVVGDYRSRPTGTMSGYNLSSTDWQNGKKVIIHVNKSVGGIKGLASNDVNKVALRTGEWPSGTSLQIDIGSSGRLQGAGGDGRRGTANGGVPDAAIAGTSALGVEYPAQINNNGIIRCGYGGGGGGAGSNSNPNKSMTDYGRSGGGGGGGAGIPIGFGAPKGGPGYNGSSPENNNVGGKGEDATFDAGGDPGSGADHGQGSGGSGSGGIGGDIVDNPASGSAGSPNVARGGDPGQNGFGIVFSSTSVQNNSSGDKNIPANQGGVVVGGVF